MRSPLLAAAISVGLLGVPAPSVAVAPAPVPYGSIWTVDTVANALTRYAPDASGEATPAAKIAGADSGLHAPSAIAVDREGRIFATNAGNDSITEFAATADGDQAPIRTIAGPHTGLDGPTSIAIEEARDGHGALPGNRHYEYLYVTNADSNTVEAFDASDSGDVLPAFSVEGDRTGLDHPTALTLSAFDEPVVLNRPAKRPATVTAYESFGNHKPFSTIKPKPPYRFHDPTAVVASGFETTWVADAERDSITRFLTLPLPRSFSAGPLQRIHGGATGLDQPLGLTRTASGDLVVVNGGDHSLRIFSPDQHGDVEPIRTLEVSDGTVAASVFGVPPSAPTDLRIHLRGHRAAMRWAPPTRTGGGLEGYFAEVRNRSWFGGRGPVAHASVFTADTTTTRKHVVSQRLEPGKTYVAIVEAVNAFGYSASAPPVTFRVPKAHPARARTTSSGNG
jgi:hypothetical protein